MNRYIMNRESLKRHCEAMCKKFKDVPTSGAYGEHRPVLDLLEQTRWIPVSEKLPEKYGCYLITAKIKIHDLKPYYEVRTAKFDGKDFDIGYIGDDISVISWMPLIQPYKEDEED